MESFKITESSLSNDKIRVYERCEPACVGASNESFKHQETAAALTLDQLYVALWCCHFLLPQDSNPPSVGLTTPHFNVGAGTLLFVKLTVVLV